VGSIAAEGHLIRGKAAGGRRGLRPENRMAPVPGGLTWGRWVCCARGDKHNDNLPPRAGFRTYTLVWVRDPFDLFGLKAVWHLGHMVLVGSVADRAGHTGRSAPTLPLTEPRPIGMGLADPSAVVASRTELHGM
jgi:hypothetical protein